MPQSPPSVPQLPVVAFFDPNKVDQGLIEYYCTDAAPYQPLDLGTGHPNTRDYPNFRLGIQVAVPDNPSWIRRVWITDETSPDWFNYAKKFAAENNAYPTFIRQYREDKKTYTPRTKGTPLDSVYLLRLVTAGTGYVYGTFPAITATGGGGSGFVGHAVVNPDGTLAEVVIDEQGTGFTSNPTFTVEAPPSGTTATAEGFVQPQGAVLLAEQAEEFPKDSEFFGLYFNVTRVYETLPGPTLDTTRIDDDGVVVTVAKTKKLCSDIDSGETIVGGVWTKITSEPDTSLTCMEVVETRELPGNPMVSTRVDDDGVTVTITKTLKDTTTITTEETATGGFWSKTSKQAVSDLVAQEVDEVRAIPGYGIPVAHLDDDGMTVYGVSTIKDTDDIFVHEEIDGGFWIKTTKEKVSDLVSNEIVEFRLIPGNPMVSTKLDDDGQTVLISKTLGEAATIVSGEVLLGGFWVRTMKEPVSYLVAYQVQETRAIPGPIQEGEQTGKWGVEPFTRQKLEIASASADEGYLVRESKLEPFQGSDLVATKITVRYPAGLYGVALYGQDYDPRLNTVIPYVQKLAPIAYGIGTNFEDITPQDYQHADVRTIDPATVAAVLNAYVFSYPGRINVDMPDLLTAVYGVIDSSTSDGADQEVGSNSATGNYSIAQTLTAQAQASANILPEAYPVIKQFWGNNIACSHYHFFLENPVTLSDVLTKLNSILSPDSITDWPKFNPEIVTLVMSGGRVSVQAKAHSQGSAAISGTGSASTAAGGTGYSEERGLTVKTMRISPTIHDTITVAGDTSGSENVSATAYAEAAGLGPLETQTTGPISVTAAITPTTIPATVGAVTWPTTGLYLYRTDPHPYRYNFIEFHCVVIDAADFPNVP